MFANETARVLLLWRSNETAGVATPRFFLFKSRTLFELADAILIQAFANLIRFDRQPFM